MTESLWAKRNRQKLFDELVTAAIQNDEIDRTLRQAHGIDAGYLRKQCEQSSGRLWGEVAEATEKYNDAAERHAGVVTLYPAGRAVRDALTSSRLQHSGSLVGLLLVMSAWIAYQPGPMQMRPHYPLLAMAMTLTVAALVLRLESAFLGSDRVRRVVDVVVVPALSVIAVVLFCIAVVNLVPLETVRLAGASNQGAAALVIALAMSLIAVPFIRTLRERKLTPSVRTAALRVAEVAAFAFRLPSMVLLFIVAGGLVTLWDGTAVVFGMPNLVLLYGGLGLIVLSALTALVGFFFRSARLIRQDYEAALERVSRQLTEIAILPFLRAEINKHTQVLAVEIDVREAPGLGQLSDPAYLVSTAAAARVDKLVETMPGGSIGLAGARGAGKTTLIESYCDGPRRLVNSVATMVSAPVEYASREFLLHLYAKVCRDVIGSRSGVDGLDAAAAVRRGRGPLTPWVVGLLSIIVGAALLVLYNADVRISGQVAWALVLIVVGVVLVGFRAGAHRRPVRVSGRDLRDLAAERLEEIRFQQSFSSTWSGVVKVPLGLEATVGGGRGLIRQPLHLPEIVDSLREFLALVAREHRVLIGIDELDKMESEAAAEQFLNEIKSIFGVRGCYFLVSVSEEAMSSFERRGLPFRDVFDSTFDEIVWFEHLTADEATASIDRRVLLMPLPFKQLCFALSGGLPRDIIRVARLVLDAQDAQGPTGLSRITTSLVAQDATRKARAISVAARRIDLEPDVGRFLLECAGFRDVTIDADSLLRLIDTLLPAGDSRAHLESTTAPAGAFLKLVGEFACFLYYAATVLGYFDESAEEARWRDTSALHLLAEARQAFSTSTRVAWEGISSFRRSWDMPAVTFPAALGPVPDRLGRRDVSRVVTLAKDATA